MKTATIKGLTILGIGAVMFGSLAATPALADGRRDDNRANIGIRIGDVQVSLNTDNGPRWGGDNDRRDNDRRDRDDRGRFDKRDGGDRR